jgi:hypothetical protein
MLATAFQTGQMVLSELVAAVEVAMSGYLPPGNDARPPD